MRALRHSRMIAPSGAGQGCLVPPIPEGWWRWRHAPAGGFLDKRGGYRQEEAFSLARSSAACDNDVRAIGDGGLKGIKMVGIKLAAGRE